MTTNRYRRPDRAAAVQAALRRLERAEGGGRGASKAGLWGGVCADAPTAVGGASAGRPQLRVPTGSRTGHLAVAVVAG